MKALQGDNDRLKTELADLRNKENQLENEVNGLPKPLIRAADHRHRPEAPKRPRTRWTKRSAATRNSPLLA